MAEPRLSPSFIPGSWARAPSSPRPPAPGTIGPLMLAKTLLALFLATVPLALLAHAGDDHERVRARPGAAFRRARDHRFKPYRLLHRGWLSRSTTFWALE